VQRAGQITGNGQRDKMANVVGRTSTGASIVNLNGGLLAEKKIAGKISSTSDGPVDLTKRPLHSHPAKLVTRCDDRRAVAKLSE